jgi:hypothetical protein
MRSHSNKRVLQRLVVAGCLAFSSQATALPWFEVGEAGQLPGTAQIVAGAGALESISGTVSSANDADMFLIFISNPATFSATTVGPGGTLDDTQLFLFNAGGLGVYANDDSVGVRSTLPAGNPNGPLVAGLYYLVISSYNNDPTSAGGLIFPSTPFTSVFGPTGPGGALPISGWSGSGGTGTYTINLTGASFVPEPGSAALLGVSLLLLGFLRRRAR